MFLVPLLSFTQSYKDLMSINSIDMFKKVMIENEFEYMEGDKWSTEDILIYGQMVFRDDDGKITGTENIAFYDIKENRFNLQIQGNRYGGSDYFPIYDKVKKECKFYKIIKYLETDYACYSCPNSSVGKIGFNRAGNFGMILNFRE